jgi:hypothetical protein
LAFSYWIDYLSFITEEKLAAMLITPSLGVPNWSVIYIINTAPSHAYGGMDGRRNSTSISKRIYMKSILGSFDSLDRKNAGIRNI